MRLLQQLSGVASLAALLCATPSNASFWTVTSYFQKSESLSTSTYRTSSTYTYTYTVTRTVKPGITPTATPTSTRSYSSTYYDLLVYSYFLPEDAVAETDLVTSSTDRTSSSTYTVYRVPTVYTAPTTCPTSFAYTTYTYAYPPSAVTDQLSPTSTTTTVDRWGTTTVTAYLSQGAMPTATTSDYIQSYYVAYCTNPATIYGSSSSSSGSSSGSSSSSSSSYYDDYCPHVYCTTFKNWIIIVATVIPGLFLLGFAESFFWFRRLMLGKGALRLGTVCWILLSLWVLCFTRKASARSKEDQVMLRDKWKTMSAGQKWKLWWRWGFRHRYPTELLGSEKGGIPPVASAAMPPQQPPPGQPPVQGWPQPPPPTAGQVVYPYPYPQYQYPQVPGYQYPQVPGYQYPQVPGQPPMPGQTPVPGQAPAQVPGQVPYQPPPQFQYYPPPQQPSPVSALPTPSHSPAPPPPTTQAPVAQAPPTQPLPTHQPVDHAARAPEVAQTEK